MLRYSSQFRSYSSTLRNISKLRLNPSCNVYNQQIGAYALSKCDIDYQRSPMIISKNYIHLSTRFDLKEPESKVDKAVEILKEKISDPNKEIEPAAPSSSIVPRPSLWQKIKAELKHYYMGSKLLSLEIKITYRLLKQVLGGHTLTRRERRHLTQTAADLFRLLPFSLFVIVPFLEFTLPIFLKLFPNMLPSTFQEESKEHDKLKKKLKAKLEMAKFLQDTLEETALQATDKNNEGPTLNQKFAEFIKKVRSKGVPPSTDEILKFAALFENEITLDNLSRQQLTALCQIIEVSTYGNIPTNDYLRFQLRMKMRSLEADDKLIIKEGVEYLNIQELQQACRDRGMRALGLSEDSLRKQLDQWLDLHINRNIPITLLLLSRTLYLPENLSPEELIKSTINKLPKSIDNATIVKLAEVSGAKIDNQVKLELLKREEEAIKLDRESMKEFETPEKLDQALKAAHQRMAAAAPTIPTPSFVETPIPAVEILVDKAPILVDTAKTIEAKESEILTIEEIKEIGQIIENLADTDEKIVKGEIAELKKDVSEYKQDLKEVEHITQTEKAAIKIKESKSAKILSKRVEKLIGDLDNLVAQLRESDIANKKETVEYKGKNMVSIDELVAAIHKIQGVSSVVKEEKILQVLKSLDQDHDGKIDDLAEVVKVFELIAEENVKVTRDQLGKLLALLEKEKIVEMDEEKAQQQAQQQEKQQQKP